VSVLLQISDPHFGTEQLPVVEALASLSRGQHPDLVVLSGDITQRATHDQFGAARTFMDGLGVPFLAIPGNHDIPLFNLSTRLFNPYARFRRAFGNMLEPIHESADLLVLCVNTTRRYRHINGEVSAAQIHRVAAALTQASFGQLRVVVVHQPVAVMRAADAHDRLRGYALAVQRWAEAGGDIVMGGHIHMPYVKALPSLLRPMWAVQAGTSVSYRIRDGMPNSVNIVRCGTDAPAGRCLIEQWDYAAASDAFIRVTVTEITPSRQTNGA
jgi:3',5'-cyclic AMP phosphodiesterase CpdA